MTIMKTPLLVDAGHPAVRIEVLDSGCRVAAKGYGRIDERLPTGLYTVRYRIGDAMEDRDVILRPEQPVALQQPPDLKYASAAPLELTRNSNGDQQNAAKQLSRETTYVCGQGAQLLVFVRGSSARGSRLLTRGLSLHHWSGEVLLLLDDVAKISTEPTESPWAGLNMAVAPGAYRLRLSVADGKSVEMPVVTCPGWQTQLFLLRPGGVDESQEGLAVDLSRACILMARMEQGFEPGAVRLTVAAPEAGEDLRLVDLACQAIAHGRRGISSRDLDAMLRGKWEDPLLGVLGVHLLLLRPNPDVELAWRIIDRLRGILDRFRHPDVEALALGAGRRHGKILELAPIDTLPMLRRSWHMLVQATADQPHLISPGSLPDRIADRLWGAGAWLMWETPPQVPRELTEDVDAWISRAIVSVSDSSSAAPGGIEDLPDRIKIRGIPVFKRGFQPPEVQEDRRSVEQPRAEAESTAPTGDAGGPLDKAHSPLVRMDEMNLEETRAAIQAILSPLPNRERLGVDELASAASLDQAEFSLLVQFATMLPRQPGGSSGANDPLALNMLVERLGLPSGHVQRAMRRLLAKLEMSRAAWSRAASVQSPQEVNVDTVEFKEMFGPLVADMDPDGMGELVLLAAVHRRPSEWWTDQKVCEEISTIWPPEMGSLPQDTDVYSWLEKAVERGFLRTDELEDELAPAGVRRTGSSWEQTVYQPAIRSPETLLRICHVSSRERDEASSIREQLLRLLDHLGLSELLLRVAVACARGRSSAG